MTTFDDIKFRRAAGTTPRGEDVDFLIGVVEAAQPIIGRINRFDDSTGECNCNTCVEDKLARDAFAEIGAA